MKSNSRTTNTILNFTSSMGGQFIKIVMQFVVRTVFINTLGKEYLGISGLFSNILSMLALTELGVGSAILYKLYEPISTNDYNRITVLMKFYKQAYRIIGVVIAILGICLIPFLPLFIEGYDDLSLLNINPTLIFLLYLIKSVASYWFFAYKTAIIRAHQKGYLLNIIHYGFTISRGIIQILVLLIYPRFELYVLVYILEVIISNFVCARFSDKLYPYINNPIDEKLTKAEIKDMFKDCSAIMIYKINGVVLKSTDNIIISMFVGLKAVALYSNYYIFYTTINTLFSRIFNATKHSLGNLHTTKNYEHEYKIFNIMVLIGAILGATAGIGIFVVADEFVSVWIGNDWVIAQPFSMLMGLEIITLAYRGILTKFRNAMGLFQQAKYRPLAGIFVNLGVSLLLVNHWGICGVIIGTLVADWTTMMWYDPLIIFKYGFKDKFSVKNYYLSIAKYVGISCILGVILNIICSNVLCGYGWVSVIIHSLLCAVIIPTTFVLLHYKKKEGQYIVNILKRYYKKIISKVKIKY